MKKKHHSKSMVVTFFIVGIFIGVSFFNMTYGAEWYKDDKNDKPLSTIKENSVVNITIDDLLKENSTIALEDIVTSSDNEYGNDYLGAMYENDINDEFKALFAISNKLENPINVGDKYYSRFDTYLCETLVNKDSTECDTISSIDFIINLDTLNYVVSKIFPDTKISNGFKTKMYHEVNYIVCDNSLCNVSITTGYRGKSYNNYFSEITDIKEDRVTGEKTYEVSVLYTSPIDNEDVDTIGIYKSPKEELLYKIDRNELLAMSFKELASLTGNDYNTYYFVFNSNGELVANK